jgi:hypothetical protein
MTDIKLAAAPAGEAPFLSDEEVRQGIELLFFAYRDFTAEPDAILTQYNFGRAHHRVVHFVGRRPQMTVGELLLILRITKQSLNRVLGQLVRQGFIVQHPRRAGSPPAPAPTDREGPRTRTPAFRAAACARRRRLPQGRRRGCRGLSQSATQHHRQPRGPSPLRSRAADGALTTLFAYNRRMSEHRATPPRRRRRCAVARSAAPLPIG